MKEEKMNRICFCCGKKIEGDSFWHKSCIKRMFGSTKLEDFHLDFDKLIDETINEGKSVTGVQKKFSLEIADKRRKTISLTNNQYIIKTPDKDLKNIVLFEWIGMILAGIVGIETVDVGIINNDGTNILITKRIDRDENKKIAMEDFAQLSNTQTEYKYNGSYERCYINVIKKYSSTPTIDKIKFYKLLLFSYIIGNTDMHLKNFSLYKINDGYQLTPAYDLVPVLMVFKQEDMALSLNGKRRNLTRNDFYNFGNYLGIDKKIIHSIHQSIKDKENKMIDFIKSTPLDENDKDRFINFIIQKISTVI